MSQLVGEALRTNKSLRTVRMSHNDVHSRGALVLAAGLAASPSVYVLDVSGNPIGRSGAKALLRCVGTVHGCREITLTGCSTEVDHGFDPSKPDGVYALNLADTYDRVRLPLALQYSTACVARGQHCNVTACR